MNTQAEEQKAQRNERSQYLGFQPHRWVIVSPYLVMCMQECLSNCSGQGSGKTNELEAHTLQLQAYTDKSLSIYAVALFPERFPQIASKYTMISHDTL